MAGDAPYSEKYIVFYFYFGRLVVVLKLFSFLENGKCFALALDLLICMCQMGHGQPAVAFPSSQPDRKASPYGPQAQQPTVSQSACEFCEFCLIFKNNLLIPVALLYVTCFRLLFLCFSQSMLTVLQQLLFCRWIFVALDADISVLH